MLVTMPTMTPATSCDRSVLPTPLPDPGNMGPASGRKDITPLLGYRQTADKVATIVRMAFAALPHENILFPVPYAENEEHPLIITNQRIVQRNAAGGVELPTKEVHTVGRQVLRPRLPPGIMLLALALPLLGFGIYALYSVWGM